MIPSSYFDPSSITKNRKIHKQGAREADQYQAGPQERIKAEINSNVSTTVIQRCHSSKQYNTTLNNTTLTYIYVILKINISDDS